MLDAKSIGRLRDIKLKAKGESSKMNQLANTQANLITDPQKAYDRFECAMFFYGPYSMVTTIFLNRAIELNSEYGFNGKKAREIKKNITIITQYEASVQGLEQYMDDISTRGEQFDNEFRDRLQFEDVEL